MPKQQLHIRTNLKIGWWYRVVSGDTLIGLARRFYGNTNWQAIYNYKNNRTIIGPNPNYIREGIQIELW